jgi:hypothetical protein
MFCGDIFLEPEKSEANLSKKGSKIFTKTEKSLPWPGLPTNLS